MRWYLATLFFWCGAPRIAHDHGEKESLHRLIQQWFGLSYIKKVFSFFGNPSMTDCVPLVIRSLFAVQLMNETGGAKWHATQIIYLNRLILFTELTQ